MVWNIEMSLEARKNLAKIGTSAAQRVLTFLHQRLRIMDNPRSVGIPLAGPTLSGLWRYRVGDYRILCQIEDEKICIVVVTIEHRKDVYRA